MSYSECGPYIYGLMMARRKTQAASKKNEAIVLDMRRSRIFEAWCAGATQLQIGAQEGISQPLVSQDLAIKIREKSEQQQASEDKARWNLLAKIAWAEGELSQAWTASKKPRRKKVVVAKLPAMAGKKAREIKAEPQSQTTTIEQTTGDPRYMAELNKMWKLRADLLGLIKTHMDITSGGKPIVKAYGFNPYERSES